LFPHLIFLILEFKRAPFPVFVVSLLFRCEKHIWSSSYLSVRLSVHPLASARLPFGGFSWNFTLGTLIKICQDPPNLNTTSDKIIGHITYRPNYVYSIDSRILHLDDSTEGTHSCLFMASLKGYMLLRTTHMPITGKKRRHCCISVLNTVTRKRHKVTLYVHFLYCCYLTTRFDCMCYSPRVVEWSWCRESEYHGQFNPRLIPWRLRKIRDTNNFVNWFSDVNWKEAFKVDLLSRNVNHKSTIFGPWPCQEITYERKFHDLKIYPCKCMTV
jgi:hypothetical protein